MPAGDDTVNGATPNARGEALSTEREAAARMLMIRASHQLSQWAWKYGKHNPTWLPPAGDVDLMIDIDEWIGGAT